MSLTWRRLLVVVVLVIIVGSVFGQWGTIGRLAEWVAGGPYLSRVFQIKHMVVAASDAEFSRLATDPAMVDRRSRAAELDLPVNSQLRIVTDAAGLERYQSFVTALRQAVVTERSGSDALAKRLTELVHDRFVAGLNFPNVVRDDHFANELGYRSEDFIYSLVNARSACGTVGEALVAILRYAGFPARLVLFSHDPRGLSANHVSAEFYSSTQGRWVLAEGMIGVVAGDQAGNLRGVADIVADPSFRAEMEARWNGAGGNYAGDEGLVVSFVQRGPVTTEYYLTGSAEIRDEVMRVVSSRRR